MFDRLYPCSAAACFTYPLNLSLPPIESLPPAPGPLWACHVQPRWRRKRRRQTPLLKTALMPPRPRHLKPFPGTRARWPGCSTCGTCDVQAIRWVRASCSCGRESGRCPHTSRACRGRCMPLRRCWSGRCESPWASWGSGNLEDPGNMGCRVRYKDHSMGGLIMGLGPGCGGQRRG